MSTPFLRQVAQYFKGKCNLQDYYFVFPNHRSCKFFERELDIAHQGVYLSPEVMPITDFVVEMTNSTPVNPIEALFVLYRCYTGIPGNEDYPFDKFIYWGNVVLNDFDDVDKYLVDPAFIFKNVKEYREIQSNYLDADLLEIISHYFNTSKEGLDDESFWMNYDPEGGATGDVKEKYMQLWKSLLQLYTDYHRALSERNLNTMGGIFRDAVAAVKERNYEPSEKYVFVGFNMLSTSELAIFKHLQKVGRALFFWDVASPVFKDASTGNSWGHYVNILKETFRQPDDFDSEVIEDYPQIEVVGVPSNVGQAKYCYNLLENLMADGSMDCKDAINTAIVLPDKGLLIPLLNSMPPEIEKKNVTMGYPLSSSDIASLMRVVAKMHRQARRDGDGEWSFYRNDVKIVLSHPLIKSFFGKQALDIVRDIDNDNTFAVKQSKFKDSGLELLFTSLDDADDTESVTKYLKQFADFCNNLLNAMKELTGQQEEPDEDADEGKAKDPVEMTLQEAFLHQYVEVVNLLIDALRYYNVPPCEATVFFLLDRLSAAYSIPFEGEPLQGLQVMGLLETRCLDFDNIIILSSNDYTLPGKIRSNTFISDFMRRYYGMNTIAEQEAMWCYYFYRLISRAHKLIMVYNTSEQAMGSNEITRYVPQLEMIYKCKVRRTMFSLSSSTSEPLNIKAPKTGHALETLNSYRSGVGERALSASTIKEYINCPLSFYFHKIEGLRASDADADFMDAGTFGSIVHAVLQRLYYPDDNGRPRNGTYKVTRAAIESFKKNKLEATVRELVDEEYLHSNSSTSPFVGEASIVSVAIARFAQAALDHDINLLVCDNDFFEVLECECRHNVSLEYGGVEFNFTYIADRIDRLSNNTLRIVDYKTGRDETNFNDVEQLFSDDSHKKRAIVQLMLYCNAFAKEMNLDEPIMPVIYTLRDMDSAGVIHNGVQLADYHELNDSFKEIMDQKIRDLFDEKVPFGPTANDNPKTTPCRFCKYMDFCRR